MYLASVSFFTFSHFGELSHRPPEREVILISEVVRFARRQSPKRSFRAGRMNMGSEKV